MDTPEGRLLPRREIRHAARRGESLRWAVQPETQQCAKERSGGVPEGDLNALSTAMHVQPLADHQDWPWPGEEYDKCESAHSRNRKRRLIMTSVEKCE